MCWTIRPDMRLAHGAYCAVLEPFVDLAIAFKGHALVAHLRRDFGVSGSFGRGGATEKSPPGHARGLFGLVLDFHKEPWDFNAASRSQRIVTSECSQRKEAGERPDTRG